MKDIIIGILITISISWTVILCFIMKMSSYWSRKEELNNLTIEDVLDIHENYKCSLVLSNGNLIGFIKD